MSFENILSPVVLKKYLEFWLSEDLPNFDLSSIALSPKVACANIQMKEEGVLAGIPFADALFKYFDCSVEWLYPEGVIIQEKTIVCVVRGLASKLMMAERTVLNILSRASGIATIASRVHNKISAEWKGEISGTRKTSPGMRVVEKYAMYVGGITTHRYDLSSLIMLKDNHIAINGSISNSIKIVKGKVGHLVIVEVECSSQEQAMEAAKAGANIVMLDNFEAKDVETVSKQVKEAHPSVLIEVSGGINETNILKYTVANVDIISSSMFCQGYKCIDLSMNIVDETIALTPDIIEIVDNDTNIAFDIDVIDLDITDKSAEFDMPKIEPATATKVGIKRKIDDPAIIIEDSSLVTQAVDNTNNDTKETETKKSTVDTNNSTATKTDVTPHKQAKVSNNSVVSATDASKNNVGAKKNTVNINKNNASLNKSNTALNKGNAIVNKSTTSLNKGNASFNKSNTSLNKSGYKGNMVRPNNNSPFSGAAMNTHSPAFRMHTSTPRSGNTIRPMIGGMALSFPGNNSQNDAFFHGATPAKLGSSASLSRSTMGNLVDQRSIGGSFRSYGPVNPAFKFCGCCNYQNPMNGPPFCRQCRNMLA